MSIPENEKIYFDNFEEIKQAELEYVELRRQKAKDESAAYTPPVEPVFESDLKKRGLIGLAFSGGGIRSASFNLGVLQALSKYGILPWVDYLSTVSGGGYIGAALISLLGWKKSSIYGNDFHFNTQWERFPFNPEKEIIKNKVAYAPEDKMSDGSEEFVSQDDFGDLKNGVNRPWHYLVEKGNFLTPRGGYVTRDILRLIGYLIGGTGTMLLLYLLFIAVLAIGSFMLVSSIPELGKSLQGTSRFCIFEVKTTEKGETVSTESGCKDMGYERTVDKKYLWSFILYDVKEMKQDNVGVGKNVTFLWFYLPLLGIGAVFATLVTISEIFINYPYVKLKKKPDGKKKDEGKVFNENLYKDSLWRLKLLGFVWMFVLVSLSTLLSIRYLDPKRDNFQEPVIWLVMAVLVFLTAVFYWIGIVSDDKSQRWQKQSLEKDNVLDYLTIEFFSVIYVWVIILAFGWIRVLPAGLLAADAPHTYILFLPLSIVIGSFAGIFLVRTIADLVIQKDLVPDDSGRLTPWSNPRFRSIFSSWMGWNIYALLASVAYVILMVPQFFATPAGNIKEVVPLSSALVSAVWAALMIYLRSGGEKGGASLKTLFALPEGIWQGIFGIMLIVLNYSLLFIAETMAVSLLPVDVGAVYWFAGVLGAFLLLTWMTNLNEISPHYFYRDRLDDAFLRTETFSEDGRRVVVRDDSTLRMQEINPENCSAPYHLVIGSINLSGSWVLDYKDRKSEHFLFSKYFTGSGVTGYVRTDKYRADVEGNGLTKYSRAVAISGAAFAASLGIMSFLAATFLLTVLNIRLGLWMVNPDKYKERKRSDETPDPMMVYELHYFTWKDRKYLFSKMLTPWWLIYLWDEARNRVSERRDLINVSDGGHTGDNAALFPLFQRRCKLIIAGDASADPAGDCVDLYRVIRMARSELGVDVTINTDDLKPDPEKKKSKKHVVIGKIHYPGTDIYEKETGWLIYIKPTITPEDRGEIRQYYDTHKNWYPHPSTGDQWFDEWQFEAQRLLGEEAVKSALNEWLKTLNPKSELELNTPNVLRKIFWKGSRLKTSFNDALDEAFSKLCK